MQEERRQRYDNAPYGKSYEAQLDAVYTNFAYKHSTIGSMEDLNAATVKDVADFFKIYYAPNNAVLTLVGDFKSDEVLAKIRKYFEDIPRQTPPPVPDMTEPRQTEERRKTLVKHAHRVAEEGRVAVRNVRRDVNDHLKKLLKSHEVSEDDEKHAMTEVQKHTDQHVEEINQILKKKESEIMEV